MFHFRTVFKLNFVALVRYNFFFRYLLCLKFRGYYSNLFCCNFSLLCFWTKFFLQQTSFLLNLSSYFNESVHLFIFTLLPLQKHFFFFFNFFLLFIYFSLFFSSTFCCLIKVFMAQNLHVGDITLIFIKFKLHHI